MAVKHIVIQDGKALITRVTGVLTGNELTDHMFWLIDQFGKALKPSYQQLFDASELEDLAVEKADINRIAQIIQAYGDGRGKVRTGIVATLPKARQMAFAYQALSRITDVDVKIYDKIEDALAWLGISRDEYDRAR